MKTQTIKQQVIARLEIKAGAFSKKRFKDGSILYIDTLENLCNLVFDDVRWDFDIIENTLNIWMGVDKKYIFTRRVQTYDAQTLLIVLRQMIKSSPLKNVKEINSVFTKSYAKSYVSYVACLQQAIDYLQTLEKP